MSARFEHVTFISAGAGSGKTYRLTEELESALVKDGIHPAGVIGTTFTVKAAGELKERVRERLIRSGRPQLAEQMAQALIGTVHSVCERLLKRFAFELGLSPELNVVSIEDTRRFFDQALDAVLSAARARRMNGLAERLGIDDWQGHVKALADAARGNNLPPEALPAMGVKSADDLLAFFPLPEARDGEAELLNAVRNALHAIDVGADPTKKTASYVKELRHAIYRLRRPPVPWSVWIALSKGAAAKKSEPLAAKVRAAAARFETHPRFHADIRDYVTGVFEIAGEALAAFRAIKTERGLIDFTDMEQLSLHALEVPAVCARLDEELELLLVDEFQDTNPMQLAIFVGLAQLADKVIFVGDVKQAIYAFRGCDPDLVFNTLSALTQRGSTADILNRSWRSRPPLVQYINAVFSEAFAGEIKAAELRLDPERAELVGDPAVLHWTLPGRSNAERAGTLARGVAELVRSGYRVVDPNTNAVRPVRWGDIAVLAATNKNVEGIARALRAAGVPMKMTLAGLLGVPEVCLAKACLRRLNDATDTQATAEIIALAQGQDAETWLADRLRWLESQEDGYSWGETTHPVVGKIKQVRGEIATQSPVEIVARVLNYVGIRDAVTAWGPDAIKAKQRQRNLDAFLRLAVEYEEHCEAQHEAATLTGFLFWLENPHSPELDLQPVVTTGDAVHVLTHHRAKGLEWPVVIATDFHYPWRSRLWDIRVEGPEGRIDLDDPLGDRVIRFWPPIFGRQTQGIPVLDKILDSEEGRWCQRKSESENRRLAYVGLTRARDGLVIALPAGNPKENAWIHTFGGQYLLPTAEGLQLPGDNAVPCSAVTLDEDGTPPEPLAFTPRWFMARQPMMDALKENVGASQGLALEGAGMGETIDLGERVPIHGDDMIAIGNALHAVVAAELVNPDREDAIARATAILAAYGAGSYVSAEDAIACARRFRRWVLARFRPQRILVEYPVSQRCPNGQVVKGWIDVLVETSGGWVIIDHKSSPRPKAEWSQEVIEHSGQLQNYKNMLAAAGRSALECWVHFPVSGGVVRVDIP